MRRYWVAALAVLTLLGMLSPPAFAQAPAPAPVTKVTITGFIDNFGTYTQNESFADISRGGITNSHDDKEMFGHMRGIFNFNAEVGKAKGVLGLEIDLGYGQSGWAADSITNNLGGAGASPLQQVGQCGGAANTDVLGCMKIKSLYANFPLTGPGSLLDMIPLVSDLTAGWQIYNLGLKPSILADTDFAGLTWRMTISPTIKASLTYAQFESGGVNNGDTNQPTLSNGSAVFNSGPYGRGNDWGLIAKVDATVIKGLTVSPIYAFQEIEGTTSPFLRRGVGGYGTTAANFSPDLTSLPGVGAIMTPCLPTPPLAGTPVANCRTEEETRHFLGLDALWEAGPLYVNPTFFYQLGQRQRQPSATDPGNILVRQTARIHAWIGDVEAGYRWGALLAMVRAMYTSGNRARDNLNEGINYYQPFQVDSTYWNQWGEATPLGTVDYFRGLYVGANGLFEGNNIGYDRYGRAQFSLKPVYNWTPALSTYLVVTPMWTAQSVPTNTGVLTTTGIQCVQGGKAAFNPVVAGVPVAPTVKPCTRADSGNDSYLGTDLTVGLTYRFAPGLTFDWAYGALIAGSAYSANRFGKFDNFGAGVPGTFGHHDAQNVYVTTARVRYNF